MGFQVIAHDRVRKVRKNALGFPRLFRIFGRKNVQRLTFLTMGSIIYFIGVVLAILAVIDIAQKPISLVGKIISIVLVLVTSWVGLAVYYLYAKNHLTEWFK